MSILEPYADESQSATERLLETSWEGRERRASERELIVEASAAALFVMAATVLVLAWGVAGLRLQVAALLIGVYAVVGRIEFPVGAGYVVPTQLILVPMLLMLPPGVVPVAVAIGLVSGNVAECALGRVPPRRILSAVPDAWHAIGPAVVLLVAGSPRIGFAAAAAARRRLRRRVHRRPRRLDGAHAPRRRGARPQAPDAGHRPGVDGGRVAGAAGLPRRHDRSPGLPRDPLRRPAGLPAVAAGARPQPAHRPGPSPPQARRARAGPAADRRAPPRRRLRRQARARGPAARSCSTGHSRPSTPPPGA